MGFKISKAKWLVSGVTVSSTNAIINNSALDLIFDTQGIAGYSTVSSGSGIDMDDGKRLPRSVSSTISGNRISTSDFHHNAGMESYSVFIIMPKKRLNPALRL
jgi:hypothetical protein